MNIQKGKEDEIFVDQLQDEGGKRERATTFMPNGERKGA